MLNQLIITLTGFNRNSNEQLYKQHISDLNMRFAGHLSEETSILVVNDVTTEKYKIAKLYQPPKICVGPEWLSQCKKNNKILPHQNYLVNKLFYGASIVILDYMPEKAIKIEQLITQNGGQVKIISSINQFQQLIKSQEDISVVLTTKIQYFKLTPHLDTISVALVDIEWLEDSLKAKRCKFPSDYAFNLEYIKKRTSTDHYKKMKLKLQKFLSLQLRANDIQTSIFQNTIIHIADNVNRDLALVLKKLIMTCGGLYIDCHSPIVTHILTDPVTENQYAELKVNGCLMFILRVEWLIDSIYLLKKMNEQDYFIRAFRQKPITSTFEQKTTNNNNANSMSYYGSLPVLNNRKSISMSVNHQKFNKPGHNIKKKYNSHLFKGLNFYVQSSQKKQIQLKELTNNIESNGGTVYKSKKQIKQVFCYYILKDSAANQSLIDKLLQCTKNPQLQPISYRWINECLSKREMIMHNRDSYIYKPFNFKTPLVDFHKIIIEVIGVDDVRKFRLKELYNSLGSMKNSPNKSDLTHCLCGDGYKQSSKFHQIRKEHAAVKFVYWKWLIQCANQGKIVQIQKFQIQIQPFFIDSQSTDPKSISDN